MATFSIYSSNKTELLAGELSRHIKESRNDPLKPEIVLVQSRGMERYIKMVLADDGCTSLGMQFPFPNHFLSKLLASLTGSAFPVDSLLTRWKLRGKLNNLPDHNEFLSIRSYLQNADPLKSYFFSHTVSDLFDKYMIHRPEMASSWCLENSGIEDELRWQPSLWKLLFEDSITEVNPLHILEMLDNSLRNVTEQVIPERIHLFGISSLPAFHLRILMILSRYTDINFYLLSSSTFHGENDEMHPFTQSSAVSVNGFIQSLKKESERFNARLVEHSLHSEIVAVNLLSGFQRSITCNESVLIPFNKSDDSIRIASCHSPLREVESLKDELYRTLSNHPDILPSDIVVMTQDIDAYAPLIESVFSYEDGNPVIPYTIADRQPTEEKEYFDVLLSLLEMTESTYATSDIIPFLELPVISQRFNLSGQDMDLIRNWIIESGARHGLDENHLKETFAGSSDEYTWDFALRRLLLGYALPPHDDLEFESIIPLNSAEGTEASLLGRFAEAIDFIKSFHNNFLQNADMHKRSIFLIEVIDNLESGIEDSHTMTLRQVISDMGELPEKTGYTENITALELIEELKFRYSAEGFGRGFLSGGITFCAMIPMRSVPFKVIAILGLNMDSFPGSEKRPSFDLISKYPVEGDRLRRIDDRQLFLEAILCTRTKLYLSYIGKNIQNNSERRPSVVVTEVIETLQSITSDSDSRSSESDSIPYLQQNRLHGFYPEYFNKDSSYDQSFSKFHSVSSQTYNRHDNYEISPFIDTERDLSALNAVNSTPIDLDDMIYYFTNPSKYYLIHRCGIIPDYRVDDPEEWEPALLDGLLSYAAGNSILKNAIAEENWRDNPVEQLTRKFSRKAMLPVGESGKVALNKLITELNAPVEIIRELKSTKNLHLENTTIRANIDDFIIEGTLPQLQTDNEFIFYRNSKFGIRSFFTAWLLYLLVTSSEIEKYSHKYIRYLYRVKDHGFQWHCIQNKKSDEKHSSARQALRDLIQIYEKRLLYPISLFPDISYRFMELKTQSADRSKGKPFDPLTSLVNEMNNPFSYSAQFTETDLILFRGINPLEDSEFTVLAETIYRPLIENLLVEDVNIEALR